MAPSIVVYPDRAQPPDVNGANGPEPVDHPGTAEPTPRRGGGAGRAARVPRPPDTDWIESACSEVCAQVLARRRVDAGPG